jgi:glycerol-3-phosphate acyltransferase PlsY
MLAPVSTPVTILLVATAGYVLGSVPVALIVARRHGIVDLRDVGDHNPGYWNTMEQLGTRAALPVFGGDALKGAAAAAIGLWLGDADQWWMAYVGGGAAMIGHSFPVFAGLRGGRSVLAFVGAALVYAPLAASGALVTLGVVLLVTRRFDWAARAGVAAFPVCQLLADGPYRTAATGILMTFIGARFAQAALVERRRAA